MPTCVFKTDDVIRCVQHALEAESWNMGWLEEETPRPALFFVHDQGVYLMSNSEQRDMITGPDGERKAYTAYAEGCNPNIGSFDEWYGTSRDLVGGDDFVETLPIDNSVLTFCQRYEELHITVEGGTISWEFVGPKSVAVVG